MIDDIKDVSEQQKQKKERQRELSSSFLKTFALMVIASVGMSFYGIFATGDFLSAFTVDRAFETAGRIAIFLFMMIAMFFAVHGFSKDGKYFARNFTLTIIVVAITYILSVSTARFLNMFMMPIPVAPLPATAAPALWALCLL